jgi:hypothetical protein
MASDDFAARITAAYATTGVAVELGRGIVGDEVHTDAVVPSPRRC